VLTEPLRTYEGEGEKTIHILSILPIPVKLNKDTQDIQDNNYGDSILNYLFFLLAWNSKEISESPISQNINNLRASPIAHIISMVIDIFKLPADNF